MFFFYFVWFSAFKEYTESLYLQGREDESYTKLKIQKLIQTKFQDRHPGFHAVEAALRNVTIHIS